ncbi:MAG: PilZ domain-containing protein [Desulfobacteraceae bacterium]|nr:PilZ domain-containing protein [Desulfobacteraceae bacterium]
MTLKVFITSNLMATFTCPECGKSKREDVSKFIGHETQVKLKYKCDCQHSFSAILERRRSKRKRVRLKGHIVLGLKKYAITIDDISKHGVRIKLLEKFPLKEEKRIKIKFILDDPNNSIISKEVRIKNIISPAIIGCEFVSYDHLGNLGKYFLFYY